MSSPGAPPGFQAGGGAQTSADGASSSAGAQATPGAPATGAQATPGAPAPSGAQSAFNPATGAHSVFDTQLTGDALRQTLSGAAQPGAQAPSSAPAAAAAQPHQDVRQQSLFGAGAPAHAGAQGTTGHPDHSQTNLTPEQQRAQPGYFDGGPQFQFGSNPIPASSAFNAPSATYAFNPAFDGTPPSTGTLAALFPPVPPAEGTPMDRWISQAAQASSSTTVPMDVYRGALAHQNTFAAMAQQAQQQAAEAQAELTRVQAQLASARIMGTPVSEAHGVHSATTVSVTPPSERGFIGRVAGNVLGRFGFSRSTSPGPDASSTDPALQAATSAATSASPDTRTVNWEDGGIGTTQYGSGSTFSASPP